MISTISLGAQYKYFFKALPKLDNELTIIFDRPILDMYEFEKMLHIRHGSYEERGLSTAELVEKEYGKEALSFCKEAFVL